MKIHSCSVGLKTNNLFKICRKVAIAASLFMGTRVFSQTTHPNVLLIILEDWGPYLGCYGVSEVQTPNIDKLANEGMRYTRCFSTAPVCSVARSALMTGMYQYMTHSEDHRTIKKQNLPPGVRSLPEVFRDEGYFTALGCGYNRKIDLNFQFAVKQIYLGKDWKERNPGQPFFAHLTLNQTHRPWTGDPIHPIDSAKVHLEPWYPDCPLTRRDWAMGLESVQNSDRDVGTIVARLKQEGIYNNTVIIITADHGVALPRSKQFLYDMGLHIPLIIHWPGHVRGGVVNDDLVSNLDIEPTILALAGIPIPKTVQGYDLLNGLIHPRQFVFAGRDRMDGTHDAMRAVRSKDYKYILNLMPERAYCQFNAYKEQEYPGLAVLNVLHLQHQLPPEQDAFMQSHKPAEELYDIHRDPYELHNLAADPAYQSVLNEMRQPLAQWRKSISDPGITEDFRNGGWSAEYPTRSLQEWQDIQAQWERFIFHNGPRPKIGIPERFAHETVEGE